MPGAADLKYIIDKLGPYCSSLTFSLHPKSSGPNQVNVNFCQASDDSRSSPAVKLLQVDPAQSAWDYASKQINHIEEAGENLLLVRQEGLPSTIQADVIDAASKLEQIAYPLAQSDLLGVGEEASDILFTSLLSFAFQNDIVSTESIFNFYKDNIVSYESGVMGTAGLFEVARHEIADDHVIAVIDNLFPGIDLGDDFYQAVDGVRDLLALIYVMQVTFMHVRDSAKPWNRLYYDRDFSDQTGELAEFNEALSRAHPHCNLSIKEPEDRSAASLNLLLQVTMGAGSAALMKDLKLSDMLEYAKLKYLGRFQHINSSGKDPSGENYKIDKQIAKGWEKLLEAGTFLI